MPSTFTPLGVELMVTGEKSGQWGTLTNTNWNLAEQIASGYKVQTLNAAGTGVNTTTLAVTDGGTGATLATRVIILGAVSPQAITGNKTVTIPLDVENWYFIKNSTSGSFTVEFSYVSGSGSSVTWAAGEKDWKVIYAAGDDGTNPNIVEVPLGMTNIVDDTSPQLGGDLDTNGFDITSASDADVDIIPNGTGDVNLGADTVQVGDNNADATITTQGTGDLILNTNNGTNSGTITIADGVDGAINLAPNGSGEVQAGGAVVKNAGTETIFIPAQAMFGTTTNGADAQAVETTAVRPELKVLDFDASTNEYAQFSIAMPKSWNLGTVTYQVFWSPSNTNTDGCIFALQGVSCTEGDTADVVFGTAVEVEDDGIGTVEDVQMSAVSGAVTIAGSPADNDYTFFQLFRNAADGSDDFTGDARVLGIKLFYTTDAANDA